MIYETLSSQYALTHQIWNSFLKENRRYAPDSMQFLETRSEVKFKDTVTQLWYATLPHIKMHPHTKFEIPTSNNIRDMLRTRFFYKLGQRSSQGHSDPKIVRDTPPSQDTSTHQIWSFYLKEYRRYAPDTKRDGRTDIVITIKTTSEVKVKVTVTRKMVRDTPPSQDAFTHQIWNSYLKEYWRYAPDTKRDGRTVRLLYASQSSFGGLKKFPDFSLTSGHPELGFLSKQSGP